jgi:hypothetical protein
MEIYNWIVNHLTGLGVLYLLLIKVLTIVQDAVDAQPKDLKPPFGKLIYYMNAIGQALTIGNRPAAIIPTTKTGV